MSRRSRTVAIAALVTLAATLATNALAFPHIVREGDTLANIAERYYGKLKFERILAAENGLDRATKNTLSPGYPIEVPTLRYHRVAGGDSWESLAENYLGKKNRGVYLAQANGIKPWIAPELGAVLVIPHQLVIPLNGDESLTTLAYRFLGSTKDSYTLAVYNDLKDQKLPKGQFLYIPLSDLPLTEQGTEARDAFAKAILPLGKTDPRSAATLQEQKLQSLARDLRSGRYVPVVATAEGLLADVNLKVSARVKALRALLTAYVALDSKPLAQSTCALLREAEPNLVLSEVMTSPKERALCPQPKEPVAPALP